MNHPSRGVELDTFFLCCSGHDNNLKSVLGQRIEWLSGHGRKLTSRNSDWLTAESNEHMRVDDNQELGALECAP